MLGTGGSFSAVHREDREVWIRTKYEKKEYLADLPSSTLTLGEVRLERGLALAPLALGVFCAPSPNAAVSLPCVDEARLARLHH